MSIVMLCRNRVADYATWKRIFDLHTAAHREAGLRLVNLWREVGEPDNVFFLLEVGDIDQARGFIGTPEAAEAGRASGVIDGEVHFLEAGPTY